MEEFKVEPEGVYKSIREWRDDEKPRERLAAKGSASLSDAELLAILIKSGAKGYSALDAAKSLLDKSGSLSTLAYTDFSQYRAVKGIGDAKAITLSAAFEIAKRIQAEPFTTKKPIKTPEDIANYFIPKLRGVQKELFYVILLNSANQIFRESVISEGSLNASIVHPREVFKLAISESANSIILLHNHPSGNPEPSSEDISITKNLIEAGNIIEIKVLDHIIIAGDSYTSLSRRGLAFT